MKLLLILLLFSPLFAEEWTYLIHAREGVLHYDAQTHMGTLELDDLNQMAGVFTAKTKRRVGILPIQKIVGEWKGMPYAMLSFSTEDEYQSIPLKLEHPQLQEDQLIFHVHVLNGRGVSAETDFKEALLYIDSAQGVRGCLFPGAGWESAACREKS